MSVLEETTTESSQDARCVLVERIVATEPFRKSARFRDLLRYLVDKAVAGHPEDLTETRIGRAVFHKASDYSPTEDSTVRVHVRQLRLKLHEYFDVAGREEPIILEIPKGGFVPLFRDNAYLLPSASAPNRFVESPPAPILKPQTDAARRPWLMPSLLALSLACILGGMFGERLLLERTSQQVSWPLSSLVTPSLPTYIVTADANYGMRELMRDHSESLQEYLAPESALAPRPAEANAADRALLAYISQSSLTSSADAVVAARLANAMGPLWDRLSVRSASDLRPRDLERGNFIFLGSSSSNPWVSQFDDELNFQEVIKTRDSPAIWRNKSPRPGEQSEYSGLHITGSTGEDYADIALLPNRSGPGSILLLQGVQQEGTESTLNYLVENQGRNELLRALGLSHFPAPGFFFEALIRTKVTAGAPNATTIVAVRRIHQR